MPVEVRVPLMLRQVALAVLEVVEMVVLELAIPPLSKEPQEQQIRAVGVGVGLLVIPPPLAESD
jgi:hypothetical protein